MKPIGVTLQRTYLTKICKKNYCATPKIFGNISGYIKKQQKNKKQNRISMKSFAARNISSQVVKKIAEAKGKVN